MRIGKISSSAEYRMDEQFQNCKFLEPNFDFPNEKILKFLHFSIWTIPKTLSLRSSENFQFGKFEKFVSWEIKKNWIWKFPKILNLANSNKIEFGNFQKFVIWKMREKNQF